MLTIDPRQIPDMGAPDSIAVVGIGGAGTHIVNKLKSCAPEGLRLITLNSDARLIKESEAEENLTLGTALTRGLSCGGDPDLGKRAAEATLPELTDRFDGAKLVFMTVGLGGGTGSGAAPIIARKIRQSGAFLVIFVTFPFSFEGTRRQAQAQTALRELALYANILLSFENDRMGELIAAEKGVLEAFSAADSLVAESIAALSRITLKPGLINMGLDDVAAVLQGHMGRCLFGYGSAQGEGRAKIALTQTLSCPLLAQSDSLAESEHILAHISGGHDLTLAEIESMMKDLGTRLSPLADIHFGVSIDEKMAGALSLIILASDKPLKPNPADVKIIRDPHLGADPEPSEAEEDPGFLPSMDEEEFRAPVVSPKPEQKISPVPASPANIPSRPQPQSVETKPAEPYSAPRAAARPVPAERPMIIEEELTFPSMSKTLSEAASMEKIREEEAAKVASPPPPKTPSEQQSEMAFSRPVKGKFAGEQQIDLIDGEDLDLPPAMRRKK